VGSQVKAELSGVTVVCLCLRDRPAPLSPEDDPVDASNEIVHEIDIFPTLSAAIGADVLPKDRAVDGLNQLAFLEGKQAKSNRDSVIFFANNQLRAVKWKDWKFHYVFQPEPGVSVPPLTRLFNLRSDPKEESDIKDANPWAQSAMDKIVDDFTRTTERYPHVPPNAPDPYVPPKRD